MRDGKQQRERAGQAPASFRPPERLRVSRRRHVTAVRSDERAVLAAGSAVSPEAACEGYGGASARKTATHDRGSVSLWVVIFTFVTFVLLVLVVDGGQTMNAKSRAADIAEQAARAAADDLNLTDLRGGTIKLNTGANGTVAACDKRNGPAALLVADYAGGVPGASATLSGCTSTVTDVGGSPALTVTATVQLSVRPALPVPPFNQEITVSAQESAYLACGSADQREAC